MSYSGIAPSPDDGGDGDDDDGAIRQFLRTLTSRLDSKQLALLATALSLLITDPRKFVRVFLAEGVFVVLLDGLLSGIGNILRTFYLTFVGIGRLVGGRFFRTFERVVTIWADIALLIINAIYNVTEGAVLSLGLAAPIAAAIGVGTVMVLVTALGILLYRLVKTYVPVDVVAAIVRLPISLVAGIFYRLIAVGRNIGATVSGAVRDRGGDS
jgi:hypothetical protein